MNNKHTLTPLYTALVQHARRSEVSFHVPGHKNGQIFPMEGAAFFRSLLPLDATELTGLDDLHAPEEVIFQSEGLLAELYGVEKSFFLVNGSTVGNLAMVMSVLSEGEVVLVQRNCHKSILHAIQLAKGKPVFLEPDYIEEWDVASGVPLHVVEKALALYPEAKALILTYPNYFGMADDIKQSIESAHKYGVPVLVDEAHGAHFAAGWPFPPSAIELGADIVVQSAHKTLPAMTMGSYLHYNSNMIPLKRIRDYLHMLQSSSPSYPIMASLDLARSYLGTLEDKDLYFIKSEIERFREKLGEIPGIKVLSHPRLDLLKITIQSTVGLSGFQLQDCLEEGGIYTELADPANVLLVLPLLKEGQADYLNQSYPKIVKALANIEPVPIRSEPFIYIGRKAVSEPALTYKEMETLVTEAVSFDKALGEIAGEKIIPYPPGIPLIYPGEIVEEETISALKRLIRFGTRFQGGEMLKDGKINIFVRPC